MRRSVLLLLVFAVVARSLSDNQITTAAHRKLLQDDDPCEKCDLSESEGGCKCNEQCDCLTADPCEKCDLPESEGGCECNEQCDCLAPDPCEKCDLPVSKGGCECNEQCDCLAPDPCDKCDLAEADGGCECNDQCDCLAAPGSGPVQGVLPSGPAPPPPDPIQPTAKFHILNTMQDIGDGFEKLNAVVDNGCNINSCSGQDSFDVLLPPNNNFECVPQKSTCNWYLDGTYNDPTGGTLLHEAMVGFFKEAMDKSVTTKSPPYGKWTTQCSSSSCNPMQHSSCCRDECSYDDGLTLKQSTFPKELTLQRFRGDLEAGHIVLKVECSKATFECPPWVSVAASAVMIVPQPWSGVLGNAANAICDGAQLFSELSNGR